MDKQIKEEEDYKTSLINMMRNVIRNNNIINNIIDENTDIKETKYEPWNCSKCTFINTYENDKCILCNTPINEEKYTKDIMINIIENNNKIHKKNIDKKNKEIEYLKDIIKGHKIIIDGHIKKNNDLTETLLRMNRIYTNLIKQKDEQIEKLTKQN